MADRILAEQAKYKAKNNIPLLLQKPTEKKRTEKIIKDKSQELLESLMLCKNIQAWIEENQKILNETNEHIKETEKILEKIKKKMPAIQVEK